MNRIEEKFASLKADNKKAFIPYICAGDPSLEKTKELVPLLEKAGADVIELGIPYSDPLADGPVIQAAALRSLGAGFKISKFFDTVKEIRKTSNVPLVAMVYYSSILGFGSEKFISLCVESGIDGLIIPDLPYEEYDEIADIISATDLCLIPLVALTSEDRIKMLTEKARGFVYCVSSLGVTGVRNGFDPRVDSFLTKVKEVSPVPACVGFGISNPESASHFNEYCDGVIAGSAVVKFVNENLQDNKAISDFISAFKK